MDFIAKLSGYKTYITVTIAMLASLVAAIHGGATPLQAVIAALVSLSVAFARAGSKKDAIHSAAIVVANLAPIFGRLAPTQVAIADAVETGASDVAKETAPVAGVIAAPAPAAPIVVADDPVAAAPAEPIAPAAPVAPAVDLDALASAVLARLALAAKAA